MIRSIFRNALFVVFILLLFPMPLSKCQLIVWASGEPKIVAEPNLMLAHVTAYTLSEQPTASGERPREGFVACNRLPFNTVIGIYIPGHINPRLFVVKDRMNDDYGKYPDNRSGIDIWTKDAAWAKRFGRHRNVWVQIIRVGNNKRGS